MTSTARTLCWTLAVALFFTMAPAAVSAADYKMLKPRKEVSGHQVNGALYKMGKRFYASEKGYKEMWKAWRDDKPPKVDFSKELVLVSKCGGPNIPSVAVTLEKDSNMRWGGLCTEIGGRGFGYWIGIVSRDGVKKLNGKDMPPAAKPAAK